MAFSHLQPSFSGGEISPSLQARTDSPAYNTWLHTARNFYVHPQGGASNRPGTLFVAKGKFADKACRVIPFVCSEREAYVLELGEHYIRFYTPAGRVVNDQGNVYELTTVFSAAELASVQYAQYQQMIIFTHPGHAPQRLTRIAPGRFSLETLPVCFGPFQPLNTDSGKKLRVRQFQQTVTTEGVAASVSFLPTVDANYFVWGYFNGEHFFYAHDYGLDLNFLVSEFNRVYGGAGFTAYNLGGVLKIDSPQATGGDCNGMTLTLEYRNSFTAPAVFTISQSLGGGSNAGEIPVEGGDQFLLESDFDLFQPGHVGALFSVTHTVENPCQQGTLGYDGVSKVLQTGSDFQLILSGSWTGQIVLEKSTDLGITWETYRTFSRQDGEDPILIQDVLEDTGGLYYIRLRGLNITAEAGYELSAQSFVQEGIVRVTGYVNARQAEVSVEQPFGSADWTSKWAAGSFCDKNGFPACVFFYQDRLGFGGTLAEPQTLWFSKTGNYTHFGHARHAATDDSLSLHLSGKQLNTIRSVVVAGRLLVFTAGSEWSIACNGIFALENLEITQQGERGAGAVSPVMVGNHVLFVQARAGTLRDFYYDYSSASFTGEDLTLCAKHLFFNQEIKDLCYQQEPDHLIWCVLSNGQLASLTYLAEQEVCAWTHHDTQGAFRSVCTIPNNGFDEVWMSVERENGWNIEKMSRRLASKDPAAQIFVDAAVYVKSEEGMSVLSGLEHLEGQTVTVLAEGNIYPEQAVTQGQISLSRPMKEIVVGLGYTSEIKTLPLSSEYILGNKLRRFVSACVRLLDSRGGEIGVLPEETEPIPFPACAAYNGSVPLQSGYFPVLLRSNHELGAGIWIRQQAPFPFTLISLYVQAA